MNHVIIGNSAAGLSAIKAIRKVDKKNPILLISREKCNAYSPVLLPYFISGQITRSGLFIVNDEFYKRFNVKVLFGKQVVAIDTKKRLVFMNDHSKIPFSKLLIATGASAKSLNNVEKNAFKYVKTLRTITDAETIKKISENAHDIVLVGAGLVSLQCIKAVLKESRKITLIVGSNQILSQMIDSVGASIIQRVIEKKDVNILFGRNIDRIYEKGNRAIMVTNFGESLPADLIIVGKGVEPNVEFIKNSGIGINKGILVNEQMETSVEDIFAAGDVTECRNSITLGMEMIATWYSACDQGRIAGLNMGGRVTSCKTQFRENITTILGLTSAIIGLAKTEDKNYKKIVYVNYKKNIYRKFVVNDQRLVGAFLLGRTEDVGVIRSCIAKNADISMWNREIEIGKFNFSNILFRGDFMWPTHNLMC